MNLLNILRQRQADWRRVGPTVGLPRHRHFVGFLNVPVQAPTSFLRLFKESAPISLAVYEDKMNMYVIGKLYFCKTLFTNYMYTE